MLLIRLFFSIVVLSFINISVTCAQEDLFPFIAQVTESSVNVRSGQSRNFDKIDRLSQGDEVLVLGKEYSWYKIKLRTTSKSFISSKLINLIDSSSAIVTGSRVNVRSKPSTGSVILTQVKKGDVLSVLSFGEEWTQIEPPTQSVGWVSDKFLSYTTKDTAKYIDNSIVKKEEVQEVVVVEEKLEPTVIKFEGKLKEFVSSSDQGQFYKVTSSDDVTYQLKGLRHVLDDFINYQVQLEGIVEDGIEGISRYPVFKVSSVQIVL